MEHAAVLALHLAHPVELELDFLERIGKLCLFLRALREEELPARKVRGVCFIGQQELCAADGSRRHVLAVVAGIIPAAADIETITLLVELVREVDLCLAVLRMALFDLEARHRVVNRRIAARERVRAPRLDGPHGVDIVADLEVVRLARADAQLVGTFLVEGTEVRLAQRLF